MFLPLLLLDVIVGAAAVAVDALVVLRRFWLDPNCYQQPPGGEEL